MWESAEHMVREQAQLFQREGGFGVSVILGVQGSKCIYYGFLCLLLCRMKAVEFT